MRRGGAGIMTLLILVCGCRSDNRASPPPFATFQTAPPPRVNDDEAALRIVAEECARLIGSINAGIQLVDKTGTSGGQQSFNATADALEAVARTLEASVYRTPDLQRLAGFYVGVARAQSKVVRDIGEAIDSGDQARMSKAERSLASVTNMEDTVVSELNLRCRGVEPANVAPPAVSSSPSAPPPTSSAPPASSGSTGAPPVVSGRK
jgi:hypothetical protein